MAKNISPSESVMGVFIRAGVQTREQMIKDGLFKNTEALSEALFYCAVNGKSFDTTFKHLLDAGADPLMAIDRGSHDARYAGSYHRLSRMAAEHLRHKGPADETVLTRLELDADRKEALLGPISDNGWSNSLWAQKYQEAAPQQKPAVTQAQRFSP